MRRVMNLLPSLLALLVGAASFAVSYNTLRLEAIRVDAIEPGWPSYLLPLMLDGAVLSGSAVLWKAGLDGRRRPVFPYFFVAALVVLSVVVNVAHAGPSPLAKALASLAPIVLLGCLELVLISHRTSLQDNISEVTEVAAFEPLGAAVYPELAVAPEQQAAAPQPAQVDQPAVMPASVPTAAVALHAQPPVMASLRTPDTAARTVADPASGRGPSATAQPASPASPLVESVVPAPRPAQVAAELPSVPAPGKEQEMRRPLRVSAAPPAGLGADVNSPAVDVPAADRVRVLFEAHVLAGGDPADSKLASDIAGQLSVSAAYVRKVIKPLREAATSTDLPAGHDPQDSARTTHLAPVAETTMSPARVLEPSLSA